MKYFEKNGSPRIQGETLFFFLPSRMIGHQSQIDVHSRERHVGAELGLDLEKAGFLRQGLDVQLERTEGTFGDHALGRTRLIRGDRLEPVREILLDGPGVLVGPDEPQLTVLEEMGDSGHEKRVLELGPDVVVRRRLRIVLDDLRPLGGWNLEEK